jgi:two-component system sensor histidine kinase DesK
MAALGFAVVPVNLGGTTYIVYAAALAPIALNPKSSMIVFAMLAAGVGAEMTLVGGHDGLAIGGWVILLIFVVGAGNVFIGERERQNAQLRQAREDIAEMAKVAERERIARDLHDLLGHTLSVIGLKSELASKVAANDPDRAVREIREVETISREALAEVRAAVEGYRSRGFSGELRNAQQALEAAGVRLDARVNHVTCSAWQEAVLALVLRESVTNVVRHAQASICRVVLDSNSADVVLTVHDDGIGGRVREGSGLAGMRERVTAAGGRVEFESAGGVTVRVRFPLAGASS